MRIYNSLSQQIEEIVPLKKGQIGMYTCGPTVYDFDHIGHGRKYIYDDLLRRSLEYLGYKVVHVQNITDVGHLVSDADEGEDKMEKGAVKNNQTAWDVANFYTKAHFDSMDLLNILRPNISCRATEHIDEQIELIKKLFERDIAYDTKEAVYFDVSKYPQYSELFGKQKLEDKQVAVRSEVNEDRNKRNPADFALWFKTVGRFENHTMHWDSPWGDGFPGWHIECSAMSMKYLGESFDIHTGGEDHLPVHHPNEIAQSSGATGKIFAKYWLHYAFLLVDGVKMSKSLGNYYRVEDVVEKGYSPLALRYLYMSAHYSKQQNFTWSSLSSAQTAYDRLRNFVKQARENKSERKELSKDKLKKLEQIRGKFLGSIEDNLNFPEALACVWELIKSNIPDHDKLEEILEWDRVLGFNLSDVHPDNVPVDIMNLGMKRERLRAEGKFVEADGVRVEMEKLGWMVEDTKSGPRYGKK